MTRFLMSTALAAATITANAVAQNPGAPATYATVSLNAGFVPDPHAIPVTAGGSISPSVPGCTTGRVANAPDAKLHYGSNGSNTLYLYATSAEDVTLLANLPNGQWMCNDDGLGNRNPLIIIPGAAGGRYDIWVGTYGQSTTAARLMISEIDPRSGGANRPPPPPPAPQPSGSGINPSLPAGYATRNLQGGFVPDPDVVQLTAGGSNRVAIGSCTFGYVASAPDVKLNYSGNGSRTLYIYARATSDITLLVNMPNAQYSCDDDGLGGGNPLITIPNAPSGRYDVWVGTYGTSTAPAQLFISELRPGN